jgi:DnaJ-class molecular chaperone
MSNESPPDRAGKFERPKVNCPKCGGTGKTNIPDQKQAVNCPKCGGSGQVAG